MGLILNSQGTYSSSGTFIFLLNQQNTEVLSVVTGNTITIKDKNTVSIEYDYNAGEIRAVKIYKVKNNSFCNYLLLLLQNIELGFNYIFIPLQINNGTITLPAISSEHEHLFIYDSETDFGFWMSMAPEIDGTLLTSGEDINATPIGFYGNYLYAIVFQNENEKLSLSIHEGENSGNILVIFNGESFLSNELKMYFIKNNYTIYDKNSNKINDNGFIAFIAPYIAHEQIGAFVYKNYFIILTREENGIHICYAEIDGNNITDFGEITGLDYKGGFLGFSIVNDTYLYLNYCKDSSYSNSVNCYYVLKDSAVVNFKVSYSEEHDLPLTGWWPLLPLESFTFTQPITKITYKINKNDSLYGKNTTEFVYYSNEESIIHSYVHFDNDYEPYQFMLDRKTYQISDDDTLQTINGLSITSDQVIKFFVPNYSITVVDSAGDTENFTVIELNQGLKQIHRIITDLIIQKAYLAINLLVRFKDVIYEEGVYDTIALIMYKVGTVGDFKGFTIDGIIENGVFDQEYHNLNIKDDITISIKVVRAYLIRFLDYDGSLLEQKYYDEDFIPKYSNGEPVREGYTFTGWNPSIEPASKNQDYTATYTIQTYTIRFLNEDGSVLETQNLTYGTTPVYEGEIPTKEGYTFNGWTPTLYPANKNQDYKAIFRNNAFAVTLYKNSAENNRIDKTEYLTSVGELTGYLRQETNIINPSIVIEYAGVIDFNYVYISTFNRYYFVNNIISVRTNVWRLDMSCDVLMTYRDTILNYECYVSRNENNYNEDIEDNYLPLEYDKVVEVTNLYNDTYNYGKVFLESNYSVVFTTIYNGAEYKVTDEQVETEFQDTSGNILEISSISLGASNYRCMGIIKNNILDNLNKLVEKTIGDDTLASYIISLIVFPVDGSELSNNNLNPTKLLIKNDETSITITQDDVSYPRGGVLTPVIANQFTIKPKYNNFLDYEPYTTYEIYLPFYGWLKLNSYQILNEQLVVTYYPQVDSEQCSITISKGAVIGGNKEVIAEVTCQLGIQIPINSTNQERINREKTANVLNSVVGSVSGVAMAGVGAAIGNPLMAMAGGMTAIGSITSGISKDMTMLPSGQSKTGSSYDGALGDRVFKLRITYPKIAVDDLTKYAKYIGRPLQTNVKLNTLTGYTVVGGVHVENLATATDNEKTDIERQLRKGVII